MIDLDQVARACLYIFTGGVLVLMSHLATMRATKADIDSWHDLAVNSQAAAAQCITVLENMDTAILRHRLQ
jgi:hypothetical protein|tara:strand:- start:3079 stop:3291 length:213 start_codon:yes stop_codon:yes gene_type:complete